MLDFLILYEITTREIESIVLLGNELKHRGYSVEYLSFEHLNPKKYLQNKKVIDRYKNKVKVVITPSLYHDNELYQLVYYACGKAAHVVDLRWEQSFTVRDEKNFDNYHYPHGDAKKCYHVCWGKATYNNLVESGVEASKLILSGPIHMDFLRPEFNGYFLDKEALFEEFGIDNSKHSVLYISSFAISSMTERQIQKEEQAAGRSLYRDRIAHAKKSQEQTFEWIEELLKKEDVSFIYRPHPAENVLDELKTLEEKYPNFKVISKYSVKQWILCCDTVTTWMSTAIVEAFFADKPCLIVRPLPFEKEKEVTVYRDAKIIDNKEDFLSAVMSRGETSVSAEAVTDYYDFGERASYLRLADSLEDIISNAEPFAWDEDKINKHFESKKASFIAKTIIRMPYIWLITAVGKIRAKTGMSFGGFLNDRADSYMKALAAKRVRLIPDDELKYTEELLRKQVYGR